MWEKLVLIRFLFEFQPGTVNRETRERKETQEVRETNEAKDIKDTNLEKIPMNSN